MLLKTLGIISSACARDDNLSFAARDAFVQPMVANSLASCVKNFASSENLSPLIARTEESLASERRYEKHFSSDKTIE
jgi:hypothetical protein